MRVWSRRRDRRESTSVETLTPKQVAKVLDERSRELLGVSGEQATRMAEAGRLPDNISGSIVGSWVMMAKGAAQTNE